MHITNFINTREPTEFILFKKYFAQFKVVQPRANNFKYIAEVLLYDPSFDLRNYYVENIRIVNHLSWNEILTKFIQFYLKDNPILLAK